MLSEGVFILTVASLFFAFNIIGFTLYCVILWHAGVAER